MTAEILKPVVVLAAWTIAVLFYLMSVRLPAMKAAGIDLGKARGGKPGALDGRVPEQAQWPAHNYIHLVEQPTVFYAIALLLAFAGAGNGLNATLAWVYVGLRVVHSLVQIFGNIIRYRFALFLVSTLVLAALIVRALILVF